MDSTQLNLTKSEQAAQLMESSCTALEWDANCDKVKAANKGYPLWWHGVIVQSGLAKRTMAKFGCSPELKITAL